MRDVLTEPSSAPTSLEGRVALVTGGARGLGAEIARALARHGAVPIAADVRTEEASALVTELGRDGHRAGWVELDVRDDEAAAEAVRRVLDEHGRIDVLVNDAGVDVTAPFPELSMADWDRIVGVNLLGPVRMTRLVFEDMAARGDGHVVNVVSTAAKRAWANASAYHATKWGLLGLSHALHVEGRASGVKVTAVIAGGMRTPFLFERFPDLDPGLLQDPRNVAETIAFVLRQPAETVVPEITVLPMRETSWP
ncbi:MAG TPA: SDR family oxidoreductase [Actinomycetota bacterium]|nr:SDR family oxidoreductase [Actinomycetota bacterium]